MIFIDNQTKKKLLRPPDCRQEHTPFKALQSHQTWKRYAHTWACILAFVIRMTERHLELRAKPPTVDAPPFTAFVTREQGRAARVLSECIKNQKGVVDVGMAVHKLSMACFAPDSSAHMGKGTFNDIVNTFIILSNLREDGTFKEPKHIAPGLADIQYLMRMVVFQDIKQQSKATGEDIVS